MGEAGAQWNNVPDYTEGGIRYGRGFMYGTASSAAYGPGGSPAGQPTLGGASLGNTCSPTFVGLPVPVFNTLYNPQPIGCKNDGFVTDFAWGYRLRVSMDYNNVLNSGVTVTRACSGCTTWKACRWTRRSTRTARPWAWACGST